MSCRETLLGQKHTPKLAKVTVGIKSQTYHSINAEKGDWVMARTDSERTGSHSVRQEHGPDLWLNAMAGIGR